MSLHRVVVRVKPGASKPYVGGSYGDPPALVVSVNAQPVDGKATDAVIDAVAQAFGLKARDVTIASGHTSRTKHLQVNVDDSADEAFMEQLALLLNAR